MKEELMKKVKSIVETPSGINLFFVLKQEDDTIEVKRADLKAGDTQEVLRKQFIGRLKADYLENEDLQVKNLSEEDERKNVIYRYDYDEFPESMKYFPSFRYGDSYETFSFENDNLTKIDSYLIAIGTTDNYCVLYKKFYPVFLLGRGHFLLIPEKERFEKFEKDLLRIDNDYQLLQIEGKVYIKKVDILEKFAGFKAVIEREAESTLHDISNLQLLEEPEILGERLKDDLTFARKMRNIRKNSPIIRLKIPSKDVVEFTKVFPNLKDQLRYSTDGSKILLTTKKSQDIFLKLMNDSYLTSELTRLYYDSEAKTEMIESQSKDSGE